MDEHILTTLIDQYLLGTISPEDRSQLEQLILSDPSVNTLVRESEAAFKVLQHEKKRRLKEKLQELDKDELLQQGFFSKPMGWLTILLLVVIGGIYLLAGYFTHASIALRNFEPYSGRNTHAADNSADIALWAQAQNAFLAKDFNAAIQHYIVLSKHPDESIASQAKWNILLAQLALEGPSPNWKMSLDTFTMTAPEPLKSKAFRLSDILDSLMYRLFQKQFHDRFSSMKPRLI
jgi:hypothetical protein